MRVSSQVAGALQQATGDAAALLNRQAQDIDFLVSRLEKIQEHCESAAGYNFQVSRWAREAIDHVRR